MLLASPAWIACINCMILAHGAQARPTAIGPVLAPDGVLVDSPHERAWMESRRDLMTNELADIRGHTESSDECFTPRAYQLFMAGPRMTGAGTGLDYFKLPGVPTAQVGIPGGCMELGESLADTARRELREETGLIAGELAMLDVYSGPDFFLEFPSGDQAYIVGATFLAHHVEGDARADGVEGLELGYFPPTAPPAGVSAYNQRLLDRCRAKL